MLGAIKTLNSPTLAAVSQVTQQRRHDCCLKVVCDRRIYCFFQERFTGLHRFKFSLLNVRTGFVGQIPQLFLGLIIALPSSVH